MKDWLKRQALRPEANDFRSPYPQHFVLDGKSILKYFRTYVPSKLSVLFDNNTYFAGDPVFFKTLFAILV